MPSKETTNKRYALSLVRQWSKDYGDAHGARDAAICEARAYATVAEIAEASGLRRQSIYKILDRVDKSVDKDAESA